MDNSRQTADINQVIDEEEQMSFRELNRQQTWILPPMLDELIPDDHPVRYVATMVDSLNQTVWEKLRV
jgi:hypothetical protein